MFSVHLMRPESDVDYLFFISNNSKTKHKTVKAISKKALRDYNSWLVVSIPTSDIFFRFELLRDKRWTESNWFGSKTIFFVNCHKLQDYAFRVNWRKQILQPQQPYSFPLPDRLWESGHEVILNFLW